MKNFQHKINFPRWDGSQRRIGLTGGIASGKSCVGSYISKIKHIPVLDADIYARQVLEPETIATKEVIKRYGEKITEFNIKQKRIINRKELSQIIFNDKKERQWLESLIHPLIIKKLLKDLSFRKEEPTIILIIPLLFEAKLTHLCSEVWVVNCSYSQQLERLRERSLLSIEEAEKQINTQIPLKEKSQLADIILDNSNGFKCWQNQVNNLLDI
tara:strand:+ start:149 stop:790 length:642 start_codon:yes stop_codon:yes gene_type:complete